MSQYLGRDITRKRPDLSLSEKSSPGVVTLFYPNYSRFVTYEIYIYFLLCVLHMSIAREAQPVLYQFGIAVEPL